MRTHTANIVGCIGLLATSVFYAAPASAFTLQDDPSSGWGGTLDTTITVSGNVIKYENFQATNITGNLLPELKFTVPFVWPRIDNAFTGTNFLQPMDWSNVKNGWYTDNFNGSGTSLTVQLTNPGVGSVLMGNIADISGLKQLPLTSPCADPLSSLSCQQVPYLSETRNPTDLVPVFSLGPFVGNQTKSFDVAFTYMWGDNRPGDVALPTAFVGYTLSAAPVPEPETYLLLSAGLLGLFLRSRSRVRRL
jgi:hypothetical protein